MSMTIQERGQRRLGLINRLQQVERRRAVLVDELRVYAEIELHGIDPEEVTECFVGADVGLSPERLSPTQARWLKFKLMKDSTWLHAPYEDRAYWLSKPWRFLAKHPKFFTHVRLRNGTVSRLEPPINTAMRLDPSDAEETKDQPRDGVG